MVKHSRLHSADYDGNRYYCRARCMSRCASAIYHVTLTANTPDYLFRFPAYYEFPFLYPTVDGDTRITHVDIWQSPTAMNSRWIGGNTVDTLTGIHPKTGGENAQESWCQRIWQRLSQLTEWSLFITQLVSFALLIIRCLFTLDSFYRCRENSSLMTQRS